ncbi:hypothetical protein ACA910_001710 [Epithemia clementina (nom. ined.)]
MSSSRGSTLAFALAASAAAGLAGYLVYHKMIAETSSTKDPVARIFSTKDIVAKELCAFIVEEAKASIAERGTFHLAVAGGSLLDLLTKLGDHKNDLDWSKVVISFANHKCVDPTSDNATLAKCRSKFADAVGIKKFVTPMSNSVQGSVGSAEANYYAKALIAADIPHKGPYPVLDMILLGLGADGHVGSCHPNGPAVANTTKAVAGSPKEGEPSSITLTIESMNTARHTCVVVCGGSQGKKEAVKKALERPAKGPRGSFPAQLLDGPIFFLDAEAAADL